MLKTFQDLAALISSPSTVTVYKYALKKYMQYRKVSNIDELLNADRDIKLIQSSIISYLVYLKQDRKTSYSFRNVQYSAIKHFYRMNEIELNWFKISKYLGEPTKVVRDRSYTTEEIQHILTKCDERMRVVILLLASTGIRLGAVARLKIGSLTKIDEYSLYQITVYENTTSEYICFCSPECTRAIDSYLSYRARYGEKLKPEAPLIREQFNTNDLLKIRYPHQNSEYTIAANLRNLLVRSGISTVAHITETTAFEGRERKPVARAHGFRKFVTTNMIRAKLNPEIREMLLGHSIGLSGSYYRPDYSEMVEEYAKVVDLLTINEEHRLRRKVSELTEKKDEIEIMESKHKEEIKAIRDQMDQVMSIIQQNPKLAHVKPEALVKKKI